jgi:hypothetical protein
MAAREPGHCFSEGGGLVPTALAAAVVAAILGRARLSSMRQTRTHTELETSTPRLPHQPAVPYIEHLSYSLAGRARALVMRAYSGRIPRATTIGQTEVPISAPDDREACGLSNVRGAQWREAASLRTGISPRGSATLRPRFGALTSSNGAVARSIVPTQEQVLTADCPQSPASPISACPVAVRRLVRTPSRRADPP